MKKFALGREPSFSTDIFTEIFPPEQASVMPDLVPILVETADTKNLGPRIQALRSVYGNDVCNLGQGT